MTLSQKTAVVMIVSVLTVLSMGIPVSGFVGVAYGQTSAGPVDVDASNLPGDGSDSNPYEISNVSELQAMEDDLNANYTLVSDIDASNTAQFDNGSGFDPVGSSASFAGSFDGNEHTITGLTIDRPSESEVGLFGSSSGTVTDVILTEVTVTGDSSVGGLVGINFRTIQNATISGSVTGNGDVGGLVGSNIAGTVRNATASGSVTGDGGIAGGLMGRNVEGTVQTTSASASVTGTTEVGGLVGTSDGSILNATASGTVTGTERVGGLVASNFNIGEIQDAIASGSVNGEDDVGGLVGYNEGTITSTLAVGSVTATDKEFGDADGLSGQVNDGTVERSYFDEQTTGQTTSADSAIGLTTAEMQGSVATENMDLAFGETWRTVSDGYPELIAVPDTSTNSDSETDTDANTGQQPASPLAGAAGEFDTDGNGDISITELGQAGAAFASGELTITELGQVGAAFAS